MIQNPVAKEIEPEDLEVTKPSSPKTNNSKKNEYNHFAYKQNKILSKDSIDDFDDMLQDFEKKYSNHQSATSTNPKNAAKPEKIIVPKSGKFQSGNNQNAPKTNASKRSMVKTPNQQSNLAMRDSIFAQFKDDPIFSELLSNNTINNNNTKNNPQRTNNQSVLNNNINLQKKHGVIDNSKNNHDSSSQQKKKFDDLFNSYNQSPDNSSAKNNNQKGYYNNNYENNNKNKNFLDEFLLDDENVKPIKKMGKPVSGVNSSSNMNNYGGFEVNSGNHVNNKRKFFFEIKFNKQFTKNF